MQSRLGQHTALSDDPVYFVHVPKTAGTTIRSIIEYLYPQSQIIRVTENFPFATGVPPEIRFVSGHLQTYFRERFITPPRLVTLLRDPIERILSAYRYWRGLTLPDRVEGGWIPVALAQRLTAAEFLISNEPTLWGELHNFHCIWIGCAVENEPWNFDQLLENAKTVIAESFWFGIVEHLDDSLECLAHAFALPPQPHKVRLNSSRPQDADFSIPDSVRAAARERNRYDYELYDFAKQQLGERLRSVRAQPGAWQLQRETTPPPMQDRSVTFSMKEGIVGSGWWAREGNADQVYRFAIRGCVATLWFWWPIAGDSYVALQLPHLQNHLAWEDVEVRLGDIPVQTLFLMANPGRVALLRVPAASVDLARLTPLCLTIRSAGGAVPIGTDHASQTSVALQAVHWFAAGAGGLPTGLRELLQSAGVVEGDVARTPA